MEEKEIWRDVKDFEGLYQVSNLGRVRSLPRYVKASKGGTYLKEGCIMRQFELRGHYLQVHLSKDGKKKDMKVHRLVAMAFIPNPDNLPQINHKDYDRQNNRLENLEWCDAKYNSNYSACHRPKTLPRGKDNKLARPIDMFDMQGNYKRSFYGAAEACRETGISFSSICSCLRNEKFSAGGYLWKLSSEEKDMKAHARKMIAESKSTKKAIAQIKDGVVIRTFSNMKEAFLQTGIQRAGILYAARGRYSQAGGYQWKFLIDL